MSGAEVSEELGEGLLAGAEEDGIGVGGGFVGEGCDVEATKADEGSAGAVVVGEAVGAVGVGDVDLNDDEVGVVVEGEGLNVLVMDFGVIVGGEVGSEGGEA
jgi:hypothetical protein